MSDNTYSHPHLLDKDELQELRSGRGATEVYERLRKRCLRAIKGFSQGITKEDREEIISEAFAEAMPRINDDNLSADGVNREIRQALWRVKKRWQRGLKKRRRHESPAESDNLGHVSDPTQDPHNIEISDTIVHLVECIELHMANAFEQLSARDRQLLTQTYEGLGSPSLPPLSFPSQSAERKARQRARKRFSLKLEEELEGALIEAEIDRWILESALAVVRGGNLDEVIAMQGAFS